ncbi:MAG: transcriptional regulator, AraC family [Chitinophagaceae bacterium]|nr:transcriptional regulator, AraC family [Chitinophagaceae bacterium]
MELTNDIYQRIVTAKIFIDENFHDTIDLDDISGSAYLSRFHFHRLFTKVYKRTPHQYLTQKRIEKAKELLEKEGLSITDVCNTVGFESLGSFSTLFRRMNGYAPQYYRNLAYLKKTLQDQQPKQFIPHCFIESYKL